MKATWWHILEPFEPIRVKYVPAAGGAKVSATLQWRRPSSFFRVIRKTSNAVRGGWGEPMVRHDGTAQTPKKKNSKFFLMLIYDTALVAVPHILDLRLKQRHLIYASK